MAEVRFEHVRKQFGQVVAIEDLDLTIRSGEFVSLLGPSGCGKSTTLRMLAGLEQPTSGTISVGDRVVNDVPPGKRDIAMVFQSYALYPHMTVAQNIEYPLKKRGVAARRAPAAWCCAPPRCCSSMRCSSASHASSRAASSSASRSAAPWCAIRLSSCSTSRCRTSTPSCARICARS